MDDIKTKEGIPCWECSGLLPDECNCRDSFENKLLRWAELTRRGAELILWIGEGGKPRGIGLWGEFEFNVQRRPTEYRLYYTHKFHDGERVNIEPHHLVLLDKDSNPLFRTPKGPQQPYILSTREGDNFAYTWHLSFPRYDHKGVIMDTAKLWFKNLLRR